MTKLEKARDRVVKAAMVYWQYEQTPYKDWSAQKSNDLQYESAEACAALAKLEGKKCSSKN